MKKFMTMIAACMLSAANFAQTTESLSIDDFEIMAGETKTVPVNLTSSIEYVGFQFDLILPEGVSIALNNRGRLDIKLDEDMADDHTLSAEKVSDADNTYRFVCFSMTNAGFYETSGTLLNLNIQAAENAANGKLSGRIKAILLVERSAEKHLFDDCTFTITCKNNSAAASDRVDITSAGYTAYVTKFNTDFSNIEGLTAYKVTKATTASATLEEVKQAPVGTALILHGAQGTYTLDKINTEIGEIADNLFKAGGGNIKGDNSTIYALGNKNYGVGFYPVAKDVAIPASKGYLEISPTSEAKAFIPFGGEATGIKAVAKESTEKDIVIYNLAGQRVAKPTQGGIYIVNGEKIFINK